MLLRYTKSSVKIRIKLPYNVAKGNTSVTGIWWIWQTA